MGIILIYFIGEEKERQAAGPAFAAGAGGGVGGRRAYNGGMTPDDTPEIERIPDPEANTDAQHDSDPDTDTQDDTDERMRGLARELPGLVALVGVAREVLEESKARPAHNCIVAVQE